MAIERGGRPPRTAPAAALLSICITILAGCGVSANLSAPAGAQDRAEGAVTLDDAAPTATPTATAAPTPTPVPEPLVSTEALWRAIDANFAVLDALDVEYSLALATIDGTPVFERNGDTTLIPASNQKVVTATGALDLLDADFRFVTRLLVDDDRNVHLVGGGDPTFRRRHVRRFAADLSREFGRQIEAGPRSGTVGDVADTVTVTEIGDVVVDPSYFPPTRTAPGWPARYVPVDVGPMSGLWIDDNQHRGDAGYLADPDLGNAVYAARIFDEADVIVRGSARVGPAPAGAQLVSVRRSPALPRLIELVLGDSDNETAEALLRQISLAGGGPGETPDGQARLYAHLRAQGIDLGEPGGDGSGLSRDNRLSAEQLIDVLGYARSRPWWPSFGEALAAAGEDGTLRARLASDTTEGNVRAKTGTLDDVRSLSGVMETADGHELAFAFIVNGEDADATVLTMDRIVVAFASAHLDQLTGR